MRLFFNIHFNTKYGENLRILIVEEGNAGQIHTLESAGNGNWSGEVDFFSKSITYRYQLTRQNIIVDEELVPHHLYFAHNIKEYRIFDSWNLKNFPENYLKNKILNNRLNGLKFEKPILLRKHTHLFRIEAPLYNSGWRIIISGNPDVLGNWDYSKALAMLQTTPGVWEIALEIRDLATFQYKYGIQDIETGAVELEFGDNRNAMANGEQDMLYIVADHYFRFKAHQMYHAAGVAVPVFSLRSTRGYGVGEFADLKDLADWAKETNLSVIQILPINDTTANHSWTDSYPYAAVSAYALHPQYLSVDGLDFKLSANLQEKYDDDRRRLNDLESVDYEQVMSGKWLYLKELFRENKELIAKDRSFRKFIKENEDWLLPYVAFCVQRDKYRTPNFNLWKTHKKYIAGKVATIFTPKSKDFDSAMLHQWVQYQLHLQLMNAVDYMHGLGISIKGDLPIGIYRYSVEAWKEPELFGLDFQAGAPPDQFTDLGQNWEFPTYDWEAMKTDGYRWWKNRFKALEKYFDAMRIDHILGFFRIWRMPTSAVQGILGYFHPAIPVTLEEFESRGIPFNANRYCRPFITDRILWDLFDEEWERVRNQFMNRQLDGTYSFKSEFNTQRKLKDYFDLQPDGLLEDQLMTLCANVLFLTEEKAGHEVYHPRFNIYKTSSYQYLSDGEKKAVYELYEDYFFNRQNELWYKNAMEKLPVILNTTEMLICGEDLGLVPDCVPAVMDRLGITALKVQRMPAEDIPFYNPKEAAYMNVVTASSHDSSTLRQWWQEDRSMTEKYFREQLMQQGTAPVELLPDLAEIIMKQHLYNDSMLAIFPLQEFLATDEELRSPNPDLERINNPAIFPHYWKYRMHLNIDELIKDEHFNKKISGWIEDSGRK